MSTRSGRAANASDPSQESSPAVDGAALGAQLAELAAAVKEIAAQQSHGHRSGAFWISEQPLSGRALRSLSHTA